MKGRKGGPGNDYYFLLPDNGIIQTGVQYSTTNEK